MTKERRAKLTPEELEACRAKQREYNAKYFSTPERKAKMREHAVNPKSKAVKRKYRATKEWKAKAKKYRATPKRQAKMREHDAKYRDAIRQQAAADQFFIFAGAAQAISEAIKQKNKL